jgi:hypothetical protein
MGVGVVLSSEGGSCAVVDAATGPASRSLRIVSALPLSRSRNLVRFASPAPKTSPPNHHDTPPLPLFSPEAPNMATQVAGSGGGAGNAAFKVRSLHHKL